MILLKGFRAKFLLLALAPLAIAQVVTLVGVARTVEGDVEDRTRASLSNAAAVTHEYLAGRADYLAAQTATAAASDELKKSDEERLNRIINVLEADLILVLGPRGTLLASAGEGAALPARLPALIESSEQADVVRSTLVLDDAVFEAFTAPVPDNESAGWLVAAHRVDQDLTRRLQSLTGNEIALVAHSEQETSLVAASPGARKPDFDLDALKRRGTAGDAYRISGASSDWLANRIPFAAGSSETPNLDVLMLASLDDALTPFARTARNLLLFLCMLAIATAVATNGAVSRIVTPLRNLAGAARSVMSGSYDTQSRYEGDDELGELAGSFNAMRKAVAERERRLSWQALHDPLTNLPNHRNVVVKLSQAIDRAASREGSVSVLSIRLARVTELRSTLGAAAADELVLLAACQLQAHLDRGAVLGQEGPSEFVLLLPDASIDEAREHVDRLRGILAAGVGLERVTISLDAEFGIATYPEHGERAGDLVRRAAIARSEALVAGQRVGIFDPESERRHARQRSIVNDLKPAIENGEIEVWFQPRIALPHGNVCGAEALVRWNHPEFGRLAPDEFVAAAEEAGTIVHLTRHVLSEAVAQCARWREQGFRIGVSVNLGGRDLSDDYLPQFVLQVLREHDVDAQKLTLEITENIVLQQPVAAGEVLESLRDIGVRLAMDDFGTGPSSLGQIRQLPIHQIKIDKTFVMPLPDSSRDELIVSTTANLARGLGLEVVAEGVESESAAWLLAEAGCDEVQGYFFAKPMPADDFVGWLKSFEAQSFVDRRAADRPFSQQTDDQPVDDDDDSDELAEDNSSA